MSLNVNSILEKLNIQYILINMSDVGPGLLGCDDM
jgi:hypothetical protein